MRSLIVVLSLLVLIWAVNPVSADGNSYVVKRGDTIWGIADAHGCTEAELLRANKLRSTQIIYAGQRLNLPNSCTPVIQVFSDAAILQSIEKGVDYGPVVMRGNQSFKIKKSEQIFSTTTTPSDPLYEVFESQFPRLQITVPAGQKASLYPLGLIWDGYKLYSQTQVSFSGIGHEVYTFPMFKYELMQPVPYVVPVEEKYNFEFYTASYYQRRNVVVSSRIVPQLDENGNLIVDVLIMFFGELVPTRTPQYTLNPPQMVQRWDEGDKVDKSGLFPGEALTVTSVKALYFPIDTPYKTPWRFIDVIATEAVLKRNDGKTVTLTTNSKYYLERWCLDRFGCPLSDRSLIPSDVGKTFFVDNYVLYPTNTYLGLNEKIIYDLHPADKDYVIDLLQQNEVIQISGVVESSKRTQQGVVSLRLDSGNVLNLGPYAYEVPVGTHVVAYQWTKPPLESEVFIVVEIDKDLVVSPTIQNLEGKRWFVDYNGYNETKRMP